MPVDLPIPNDPLFAESWGLYNFGQPVAGGELEGTAGADVHVPEAWTITAGSPDVVVAVVDTGAALDHPDLLANIWTNPGETGGGKEDNGVDDDGNGFVDDWRGWDFRDDDNDPTSHIGGSMENGIPLDHGTAVASVIAAEANNGIGIAGVAPGVRLMILRAGSGGGQPGFGFQTTSEALEYAIQMGAQVVNMSYGTRPILTTGREELEVMQRHPDVLFVTAAGNAGQDNDALPVVPCNHDVPNLICVAASDENDELADWGLIVPGSGSSNLGLTVDVAAPGVGVIVAQPGREVVFNEDFENGIEAWTNDGSWELSETEAHGGQLAAIVDVGGTEEASEATLIPPPMPGVGEAPCILTMWVNADGLGEGGKQFRIDTKKPGEGGRWIWRRGDITMASEGDGGWQQLTMSLWADVYDSNVEWRLHATSYRPTDGPGVLVDDIEILCPTLSGDREYAYTYGTSFAAPVVSGVAALVLSEFPELNPAQVREAILGGVDQTPGLAGLVGSGGRVNAWRSLVLAGDIAGRAVLPPSADQEGPTATTDSSGPTSSDAVGNGGLLDWILPSSPGLAPDTRPGSAGDVAGSPERMSDLEAAASEAVEGESGSGDGGGLKLFEWIARGFIPLGIGSLLFGAKKLRDRARGGGPEATPRTLVSGPASKIASAGGELVGVPKLPGVGQASSGLSTASSAVSMLADSKPLAKAAARSQLAFAMASNPDFVEIHDQVSFRPGDGLGIAIGTYLKTAGETATVDGAREIIEAYDAGLL